jgi:hypothetical protein
MTQYISTFLAHEIRVEFNQFQTVISLIVLEMRW